MKKLMSLLGLLVVEVNSIYSIREELWQETKIGAISG